MMSSIESFEEAARLDGGALRRLLESPRPEQRVWAIWALALRNQDVVGLAQRTAVEHDPGVRRTIAVILASHGETDLLVALSRHDPAIVVRASAMQLVTRLAAGGAIDRSVVLDAERREPEIQAAILAAIDAGAPEFLIELAGRLLGDDNAAVQLEAFETLVRVASPASIARATAWLRDADKELVAGACRRWTRVADARAIARAVAPLSLLVRRIAIRALHAPSWSIIEQLLGDDPSLRIEAALRTDVTVAHAGLLPLLVDCPGARAATAVQQQLARLDVLPPEAFPQIPALRAHCRERGDLLRAEIERLDAAGDGPAGDAEDVPGARGYFASLDHDEVGDLLAEIQELGQLVHELDRLARRGVSIVA